MKLLFIYQSEFLSHHIAAYSHKPQALCRVFNSLINRLIPDQLPCCVKTDLMDSTPAVVDPSIAPLCPAVVDEFELITFPY